MSVTFPKGSQLQQSRATQPYLITSLVYAVFFCDHTSSCEAYSFTTDGYICGIFNVPTHLGVCHTHKGGSSTNKSAQELTRTDRQTVPHSAPSGDWWFPAEGKPEILMSPPLRGISGLSVWSHMFIIYSLVLLPSLVALSVLSFSAFGPFYYLFFPIRIWIWNLRFPKGRLFCVARFVFIGG